MGADVGANVAVFAAIGSDHGAAVFQVNELVGTVVHAVATANAAHPAQLLAGLGIILGCAGDQLCALVRHNDRQLLGTYVNAGGAAHALQVIHLCGALLNVDGVEAASLGAVAEAGAAIGAVAAQVHLSCLTAGSSAGCDIDLVVMPAAAAADKCGGGLQLSQIMVGVHDDLLTARDGAGCTAQALLIVDHSAVVHDRNGVLGTCLSAVTAADAAMAAQLQCLLFLILVGAQDEVGGVFGNHLDQALDACSDAVAAAVALFLVQLDAAVHDAQSALGTCCHAGTGAHTAIRTFAIDETGLDGLFAGSVVLQARLTGCATGTFDRGDLLFQIVWLHTISHILLLLCEVG